MPGPTPAPEPDPILHFLGTAAPFEVGPWTVVPRSLRLARGGREVRLEPRVMALLVVLARNAGKAVTRDELLDAVWSDVVVGDDALTSAVSKLRRALDGSGPDDSYIETIPKVGYRLVAPVTWATEGDTSASPPSGDRPTEERSPGRAAHRWWWLGVAALALLAVALWLESRAPRVEPASPVASVIRPVTSFPGLEIDPAIAPGGTADRVAFAWRGLSGENWDIYVAVPGSGDPLRLTDDPATDVDPAWSPDGRRLAFLQYHDGDCSIRIVSPVGGDARQLASCAGHAESLGWTPDGKQLVFATRPEKGMPFRVVALSVDTLERRALSRPPDGSVGDLKAAVSPDGSTLAFIRSPILGVEDIHLVAFDGGLEGAPDGNPDRGPEQAEPRRLTHDNLKIHGLAWTPDGEHLVFSSNRGGLFSLWRIAATGGEPVWLGLGGGNLDAPSVGAEGRIAYEQWTDETNIYRMSLGEGGSETRLGEVGRSATEGSATRRLEVGATEPVVTSTRWDWQPAVSPDGGLIAFVSDRSGSAEVWVAPIDGGMPRQRTRFGGPYVTAPSWAPNGRQLAFEARPDGNADIYVLEGEAWQPRRLTTGASQEAVPTWSRDGEWIYFASDRTGAWEVWKIPSGGGEPIAVTRGGGFLARESPDGTALLYSKHGEPGIFHLASGETVPTRLIGDLDPIDRHHWTLTDRSIYSMSRPVFDQPVLVRYDLSGANRTELAPLGEIPYNSGLALAPDESFAFFSRIDRLESDIHLVELAE